MLGKRHDGGSPVNHIEYPDLGAKVFPSHVPEGVLAELPTLYSSLLSTEAWFELQDKVQATGACVLERPRHVLLFHRDGDTLEILNKEFEICLLYTSPSPRDRTRSR